MKTKALTTSEAVILLFNNGFKNHEITKMKKTVFGCDYIVIEEYNNEDSYIKILKNIGGELFKTVSSYSKLSAKDKKELINFLLDK